MDFQTLVSQLTQLFLRLNKQQKIVLVSSVVVVVAFLIFLVLYEGDDGTNKGYAPLFEKLNASDASAIVEQLEVQQIPYNITKDNIIEVPKEHLYKQRMKMASLGYPTNSGVGFELFDTQEFGATKFDQNVKYLRALEGELSRTIAGLSIIDSAKVHIALPKESLFVTENVQPTASITLAITENMRLSPKQINGIKHLVSASIPKLTTENVMIISSDGEALGEDDELTTSTEEAKIQMRYKAKIEKTYEDKIINVLAPFIGSTERVVAKVSVELDFSRKEQTKELYDPENVIRSEQILEEKREGFAPKDIGGVPGAVSNIGPVQGLESQQSTEKYSKNQGTTNYEISKTVSTIKGEFATIKRITAAVVVDGKYISKKDADGNPTDELEYIALDDTQLVAIENLVKQSIGVLDTRGDEISVKNFQFSATVDNLKDKTPVEKTIEYVSRILGPLAPVLKYIIAIIVLVIFYKKVIVPFSERMLEVTKEDDDDKKPHIFFEDEEEEDLVGKVQEMRKKVENQLGLGENFDEDELKYEVLLEKVKTLTEDKAEELASVLSALVENEASDNAIASMEGRQSKKE